MFKELFSLPLKIANIPMKVIDNVVFDGDEVLSAPLDAVGEGVESVGEAVDDAVSDTFES